MSRLDDLKRMVKEHGNSDACLLWPFASNGRYGHLTLKVRGELKQRRVHVLAFELFVSPDHDEVLHNCDVTLCFNPKHLFSGTQDDNMRDCAAKGRTARLSGVNHWRAQDIKQIKLFERIRRIYACGCVSMREVAMLCGVSRGVVYNVIHNKHKAAGLLPKEN